MQTLRGADDLRSARTALVARIISLARAHDLLTERSWSGADLRTVMARAKEPFAVAQIDSAGIALEISRNARWRFPGRCTSSRRTPRNTAPSPARAAASNCVGARKQACAISLGARAAGPRVTPPTRRGFGSRLLEDGLLCGLGGDTRLDYAADGVRCEISALL